MSNLNYLYSVTSSILCFTLTYIPNQTFEFYSAGFKIPIDCILLKS